MRVGTALVAALLWTCALAGATGLGSAWHPDADGDGVATAVDRCPAVYDPTQADADDDGLGDACDPDFAPPAMDGPITDLRVEHVTPYGAWVDLTSPDDSTWGWRVAVAWSTDPAELTTPAGFQAAYDRGDAVEVTVEARFGEALAWPIWITALEPATSYWLAATRVNWDGLDERLSPLVAITTAPAPPVAPATGHPRVWTTPAQVAALANLRTGGDARWWTWENLMRPRAHQAAVDPDSVYRARDYCTTAALLYRVGGQAADLTDAVALLQLNVDYWEQHEVDGDAYRWEDAQLGACLDLLWPDLAVADRERAALAFLDDDERHIASDPPRARDTDEYVSSIRNWLVHGLTLCGAGGVGPAIAARGCAVLEQGLRSWYGAQLVKARREQGVWAQCGGFLPDGTDYGQGTATYWLQSALALANAGDDLADIGPFLRHLLQAEVLNLLTPTGLGYATAGDVEDFSYNFGVEPNSFQLETADAGLLVLAAGVLDAAGDAEAAAWARWLARTAYPDDVDRAGFFRLLFDHTAEPGADHRQSLAPAFLDSGTGVLYDRTSWSPNASFLVLRGGWNGPDHSHGDVGHFQLFRRGRWITHEAIGYDGPASTGAGHNVPLLALSDDPADDLDQFRFEPVGRRDRLVRASSGAFHAAVVADLTGAYTSYHLDSRRWQLVQRQLVWLKDAAEDSSDVVLLLDRVEPAAGTPTDAGRRWQLHLDAAPVISGWQATAALGDQQLDVRVLRPVGAVLTALAPDGPPDTYPGQVYTHRLAIDPAEPATAPEMLAVLQAMDTGATPLTPALLTADQYYAVRLDDRLVVLPRLQVPAAGDAVGPLEIPVVTSDPLRVFLTGLAVGAPYAVAASQHGPLLDLVVTADAGGGFRADGGGVLAVDVTAGRQVVPVYLGDAIFADGFESGDLTAWSAGD